VLFGDRGYGMLRDMAGSGEDPQFDLATPDFHDLAVSFGARAARAASVEEFESAFEAALAYDGPTLIHVTRTRLVPLRRTLGTCAASPHKSGRVIIDRTGMPGPQEGGTVSRSRSNAVRPRRPLLGALLAMAVVALAACGGSSGPSGESGERDPDATLRLTYTGVQTLDPALNTGSTAMLSNTWPVYERLLQISEDGEYLPMLATDWSFSEDGTALALELRDDAVFSDGAPFDAEAVRANIERYQEMDATSAATAIVDRVEVVDENTATLHLTRASRDVLTTISAATGIMISPAALDDPNLGTSPVGTGPWVLDGFRPGEMVSYALRPDTENIWDPKAGKVARVEIAARDTEAAYAALRGGQIDVALSNGNVAPLQTQIDSGQLVVRPLKNATTTTAFYMNHARPPFDDVRVRQAVNHAIDREAIVEALVPTTTPRVQPLASVVNGVDESLEDTYTRDPGKARHLLEEAGYGDGRRVGAGTVYVANYQPFPSVAQSVQADLAEVGIDIELELYDVRQLAVQYSTSDRTGSFSFMSYPGIEPGSALRWFFDNPLTMPGGVPKQMAQEISEVDDPTVSAAARAERASAVVERALEQAYYAPLYQGVPGWVQTDKLHGVETGKAFLAPLGGQDLRHAWLSK
jgi:peptide/nickel transport system substrate-binding protein